MVIKKLLEHKTLLVLLFLYTCLITWASLANLVLLVKIEIEGSDKIGHFIAYFIFTLLWFGFFFFSKKRKENFKQSIIKSLIICILYGGLMELFQMVLTDYRSFDWNDIVANTSGVIFAVVLIKFFESRSMNIQKTLS